MMAFGLVGRGAAMWVRPVPWRAEERMKTKHTAPSLPKGQWLFTSSVPLAVAFFLLLFVSQQNSQQIKMLCGDHSFYVMFGYKSKNYDRMMDMFVMQKRINEIFITDARGVLFSLFFSFCLGPKCSRKVTAWASERHDLILLLAMASAAAMVVISCCLASERISTDDDDTLNQLPK